MRLRRILFPGLFAIAVVHWAAGCRYDWTYVEPEGEGGTKDAAGGSSDGSSRDAFPVETDASPPPPPAECSAASTCPEGTYCAFSDSRCGKAGGTGKCQSWPSSTCESQMVCACSGDATDKCVALKNGLDFDPSWATCGTVEQFKCGTTPALCNRGVQFCQTKATAGTGACGDLKGCALGCGCPEVKAVTNGSCTCDDKKEPGAIFVSCP